MSSIPTPAWGLVGVLLGFFLGEGYRLMLESYNIRKMKEVLQTELLSINAQIKSKEDILLQAIQSFQAGRVLPTISVRTVRTGYDAFIGTLYLIYSERERNCLHVIYERLRISDEIMDSFDKNFKESLKSGLIEQPWGVAVGQLEELLQSYDVIDGLIQSFLDGIPKDVFPRLVSGNRHDQPLDAVGTNQGQ